MSNSLDTLVYMANQIARNMATMERDPTASIADHIHSFWDPRMKTMIFAHLAAGGEGLLPTAHDALATLAVTGAPLPQTHATEFATGEDVGHSDAG